MADIERANQNKSVKAIIKDDEGLGLQTVTAYFNPKEVSIKKPVPWQKHKDSKSDSPMLEFTAAEPRTMDLELLFDTYESDSPTSVYAAYIKDLEQYTLVNASLKRPPMCLFVWGSFGRVFKVVITNLAVKYTLFLPDGTPVRATATISFQQADKASVKQTPKSTPRPAPGAP